MVKIGNGCGFWGDDPAGPIEVAKAGVDFLTLDYLAELSLGIMAHHIGYAADFLETTRELADMGMPCKVITNAGGLRPKLCAEKVREIVDKAGHSHLKIGVVYGDDRLDALRKDPQNSLYRNLDDGRALSEVAGDLLFANAYLGRHGIVEALGRGADIVVTGRVSDPSLTVAAAAFAHNWPSSRWNALASATLAGHLIECGRQVTGGISTDWLELASQEKIGFPIAQIEADGSFTLTKTPGSGGAVTVQTVTEQLLYEIGDPKRYLSADVTADFTSAQISQLDSNRVRIEGVIGSAPPSTLKVGAGYLAGYRSEAMLVIRGRQARQKAKVAGEALLKEIGAAHSRLEPIGSDEEAALRMAVLDPDKEVARRFSRKVASLVTAGPQSTTGYMSGRPPVREEVAFWPCLINSFEPEVEIV